MYREYEYKTRDGKSKRESLRDMLNACKCHFGPDSPDDGDAVNDQNTAAATLRMLLKLRGEIFDAMELEMLPGVDEKRKKAEDGEKEIRQVLGLLQKSETNEEDEQQHKNKRQKVKKDK